MSRNSSAVWGSLFLLILGVSALRSSGQTTQPVTTTTSPASAPAPEETTTTPDPSRDPGWVQTIERLAGQLSGQDLGAIRHTLDRDTAIRKFSSDATVTPERLLASTMQAKLLGAHAYPQVPQTLASDLGSDFRNAGEVVPQQVRDDMTPPDEAAAKRANETAAAWVTQVLQPRKDQPVGVIVFWPTETRLPGDTSARRAIFVLIKGHAANGAYAVERVAFGDPLETPR